MILTILVRIAHFSTFLSEDGERPPSRQIVCAICVRWHVLPCWKPYRSIQGTRSQKGLTPRGGTNEWQRWADVIFYWPQVMRKCWGRKASSCWIAIFFSKHLAVLPKLCQKKSWQRWNQEKRSLWFSKLSAFSFSGSSSFWNSRPENQQQSGHFPRWGISDL